MKSWRNIAVGLATVAALGAAAGAVQAQGAAPAAGYGHSHDPVAAADKRLTRLKADLKITSAQETAWNAYAEQVKQHAGEMQALHNQMRERASGNTRPTAPERVERLAQFTKQQGEYLERLAGLTKDLYATLTPEQKTLADQRLGGGRHHRHRA
ncbi:MAG TPA: Spy/CpxP family protein refolding chaperone [Burkholderiales bacterium]|nr:Spy/CpxP family protein refolding chaperone [Burkholderiales bacterium]